MTFTIGYPIHNKSHMMNEIMNGLIENIKIPIDYIFIFDGCTDNSEELFDKLSKELIGDIKKIRTDNLFQLKTCNILMKEFKTDFLIMFQDDMVLEDFNFLDNIIKIHDKYGDDLGIIGCRDGFEKEYTEMFSSKFSGNISYFNDRSDRQELKYKTKNKILSSGEFFEKSVINMGPLIVSRKLVDTVGYFDEIYDIGVYEEMEYSLICKYKYNLKNVILGIDLIHSKFEHKSKNDVKHTSLKELRDQYPINYGIYISRWEKYWKI